MVTVLACGPGMSRVVVAGMIAPGQERGKSGRRARKTRTADLIPPAPKAPLRDREDCGIIHFDHIVSQWEKFQEKKNG